MNLPTTLMFPMHYPAKDGIVHCYPGDDFYPKTPNFFNTEHDTDKYVDKTCDECRELASNLHRLELTEMPDAKLWQNVKLPDNHLNPQTMHKSKL